MNSLRILVVLLVTVLFDTTSARSQPTYPMDTDPIKLGMKAWEQGRMDEARSRFDEARTAGYQVDRAAYGLARIAASGGRTLDAEQLFREAIEIRQRGAEEFPQARADLGRLLLGQGRNAEAGMEFDLSLAADPKLWTAHYGRGRLLLVAGDAAAARREFDLGEGRKGTREGEDLYHHGMALCHLAEGDLTGAEAEALVAANLSPADPDYAILVATVYERKNIPALAIGAYEKALAAPGHAPTASLLCSVAGLYQRLERYTEARDRYLQAIQVDSTYAPAFLDLGNLFRRARQYDRAALSYRRFLDLMPGNGPALLSLAEVRMELNQPGPALEAARSALAADSSSARARSLVVRAGLRSPDKPVRIEAARQFATQPDTLGWKTADWMALATAQANAGDEAAALASFQEVIRLEPESAEAWFQYGLLDLNAGRPDSAQVHLEKAIAFQPDAPLAWLNLGIALFQAQKTRDAIPAFRKALVLDETLPMGRLLLAQALAVNDSLRAAEVEYRRVLEKEPGNARALRGVAYCQIRGGRYAEASKSYEAATKAEPKNADGWAGLGNAYLGLSRLEESEAAFQKARAIDPGNSTMQKGMELLKKARTGSVGGG